MAGSSHGVQSMPGAAIYLLPHGGCDEQKFARAFRATWDQIPAEDRQAMLAYWGPEGARIAATWSFPDRSRRQWGQCEAGGRSILFFAPLVELMPLEILGHLVAHELAHALNRALGVRKDDRDEEEGQVAITLDRWRLPEHVVHEWAARRGVPALEAVPEACGGKCQLAGLAHFSELRQVENLPPRSFGTGSEQPVPDATFGVTHCMRDPGVQIAGVLGEDSGSRGRSGGACLDHVPGLLTLKG